MKKTVLFIVFAVIFFGTNTSSAKNLSTEDVKDIVVRMIDIQKNMGSSDAKISITDAGPVMRFGVLDEGKFTEYAIFGYNMGGPVIIVYQIVKRDELLTLYSEITTINNGKVTWEKVKTD